MCGSRVDPKEEGRPLKGAAWISSAGGRCVWPRACLAFACVVLLLCGFGSIAEGQRGFYSWEMESVSESSQQQKRKLVTHGLEDQKRVSGRTFFVAWLVVLESLGVSQSPGGCPSVAGVDACVSFSREAGRAVAHGLPGPSAGLEAWTCWWARGGRKKEREKIQSWEPERP